MLLAVDSETTGLNFRDGAMPFFVSCCDRNGNTNYWRFPVDPYSRIVHPKVEDIQEIQEFLAGKTLIFHNAKFDIRSLLSIGIDTRNHEFEETLLASHAVSSYDNHGLKELALKYLDYSDRDEKKLQKQVIEACNKARKLGWTLGYDHKGKRQTCWDYWIPGKIDPNDKSCEKYACQDAERTMLLWLTYNELMDEMDVRKGYEKEKELLRVVYKTEEDGINLDMRKLNPMKDYLTSERKKSSIRANYITKKRFNKELNLGSSKQLQEVLHGKKYFNLPVVKYTDKGGIATDKDALGTLYEQVNEDSPEGKFLYHLLFTRAFKAGIGYLNGYELLAQRWGPEQCFGRLYPSLNQTGTRTTRFSSSNPNGQNIGKRTELKIGMEKFTLPKLRDVFSPPPGKVWYAIDYSQLELRIFAYAAKEQILIDTLNSGEDLFYVMASRIFKKDIKDVLKLERQATKNTTYATIYGASPAKIDQTAGVPGAYKLFMEEFANAALFMQELISSVRKTGNLRTLDGYRLDVPISSPYKALNYLIQGTAGRIAKMAMLKVGNLPFMDWSNCRIVLQIHDELIIEFSEDHPYHCPRNLHSILHSIKLAGGEVGINTPVTCNRITTDWGHGEEVTVTENEIYRVEK